MSGQYPPPPAARRSPAAPAPHTRGAPAPGHGDAQQREAVRGRGARPARAETGAGGRPGGPRLHAHPRLPRVPPLPGPAGTAVARPQRGEPGVGEDHQQQRARVVLAATGRAEAGRGRRGGAGAAVSREPGLVQRRHLSGFRSQSLFQKIKEPDAPARDRARSGSGVHPETLHPSGKGRPSLLGTKTSSPSGPFPLAKITEYRVGGPYPDQSDESVESSAEFPLVRGQCTLRLVLTEKKLNREVFLFWICIFLLMFFSLSSSPFLLCHLLSSVNLFCVFWKGRLG